MDKLHSLHRALYLNEELLATDIRSVDNTTLASAIFEKIQISTEELDKACKNWDMKIDAK